MVAECNKLKDVVLKRHVNHGQMASYCLSTQLNSTDFGL